MTGSPEFGTARKRQARGRPRLRRRQDSRAHGQRLTVIREGPVLAVLGQVAQVALAWVLRNPVVSPPIVGATKPNHLTCRGAMRVRG